MFFSRKTERRSYELPNGSNIRACVSFGVIIIVSAVIRISEKQAAYCNNDLYTLPLRLNTSPDALPSEKMLHHDQKMT